MQIAQDKQPTVQGGRQNAAYEERSGPKGAVTTTDRGGSHGQAVVAATGRGDCSLARLCRFLCDASNAHAFIARLLLVFVFKKGE